jgi:hypothetical protein
LFLNPDAARGELRVAILEADGRPIRGLSLEDCAPLRSDVTRSPMRWRSDAVIPADRAIVLHLALRDARLFSVSTSP